MFGFDVRDVSEGIMNQLGLLNDPTKKKRLLVKLFHMENT